KLWLRSGGCPVSPILRVERRSGSVPSHSAQREAPRMRMCAGFPSESGDAHRFLNRSTADAFLLVVGDRTANDEVSYPDIDMHGKLAADGKYRFTGKNGTPF